ncbi:unnamed protein product, partial [Didymodactylos carnosus]
GKSQEKSSDVNTVLRGRITHNGAGTIPSNSILLLELQDTTLQDTKAKTIAKIRMNAKKFPILFTLKYSANQIKLQNTYTISARIEDKKKKLLFINDMVIQVIPKGNDRTKTINVPVIRTGVVQSSGKKIVRPFSIPKQNSWPNLVGMKGEKAVNIIKQETGFTNVMIIKQNSAVTMDFRADRVRVLVDGKGNVASVPIIA